MFINFHRILIEVFFKTKNSILNLFCIVKLNNPAKLGYSRIVNLHEKSILFFLLKEFGG